MHRRAELGQRIDGPVSPSGLQRFFESVVREGEEELLAHPERLATLAAEFGSQILGDYPNL